MTSTIVSLPELIASLPVELQTLCQRIWHIERVYGHTVPPTAMHAWLTNQFGGVAQVRDQPIIKVTNRWTLDAAIFNPLRARRPHDREQTGETAPDEELERSIAASAGPDDMFSDPHSWTPADTFGRVRGRFCTTASNVAHYDGWHGLVIFDEFHPLRFEREQLRDYFDVALYWLQTAHREDPPARYPLITWNCLWKSGATITHGHLQMVLSREMASGQIERRRRAEGDYRDIYDSSLSYDLWLLHDALGLSFHASKDIRGYVSLTPFKDREVFLVSNDLPELTSTSLQPLWDATFDALRGLIDHQGVRSFNVIIALPPLGPTTEYWDDHSAWVRIVDRGDPLSRLVSIGAMELFASSVIATDPFSVAAALRSLNS